MKALRFISLTIVVIALTSCNKTTNNPSVSCLTNTGSFSITINGSTYNMVTDSSTYFTILYNWFGNQESNFVVSSSDQNGNPMSAEFAVSGVLTVGTSNLTNQILGFDIDVDTFSLYVSNVIFDVTESSLSQQDGIYRPVVATFTGVAHSYPWTNGQPPFDTLSISGSFCLNGLVIQ